MNKNIRQKIRESYQETLPYIKENYPKLNPYIFDWTNWLRFTPIEENVWSDIRTLRLPMFPQFPVKGYFVDFADPVKKIGIEVDGKKWHRDKEKDDTRQKDIESQGWTIYRIQGKHTFTQRADFFGDEFQDKLEELYGQDREDFITEKENLFSKTCSEGILLEIKTKHYEKESPTDVKVMTFKELTQTDRWKHWEKEIKKHNN